MKIIYYLIQVFGYSLLLINYGCDAMPNNKKNLENTLNRCPDKPLGTLSKDDVKGNVNIVVIAPDGSTIGLAKKGKLQWQGQLPSNRDYTVEVSATTNASYTFNVEFQ